MSDLEETHEQRLAIAMGVRESFVTHVGAFTIRLADIDLMLTDAISGFANPTQPGLVRPLVQGRFMGDKLNMLAAVMPARILDGQRLVKKIKAVTDYRNTLAHSTVGVDWDAMGLDGDIPDPGKVWQAVRERKDGTTTIDVEDLRQMEVLLDDVYTALSAVFLGGIMVTELRTGDLYLMDFIEGFKTNSVGEAPEVTEARLQRLRALFPKP